MMHYKLIGPIEWSMFKVGEVYQGDYCPGLVPVKNYAKDYPNDWEVVVPEKWMCAPTEKYLKYMEEWRDFMSNYKNMGFDISTCNTLLSKHRRDNSFYHTIGVDELKKNSSYTDYTEITAEEWYKYVYLPWKTPVKPKPTYGGQIADFPVEVVEKMLEHQVAQGNPRDASVFEENSIAGKRGKRGKGFDWRETPENDGFWHEVIFNRNFDLFFQKYPKNKSNQISPLNSNQNVDNQIIGSPVLFRLPKAQYRTETITGARVHASTQKIAIASGQVEHRARAAKA